VTRFSTFMAAAVFCAAACSATAQQVFVLKDSLGQGKHIAVVMVNGQVHTITNVMLLDSAPVPPPVSVNPYPAPSTESLRKAVEPITKIRMSRVDSQEVAATFHKVASQIPDQLKQTNEIGPALAALGKPLGLQGKYAGLSAAVEAAMFAMLTDDARQTSATDAIMLRHIAWAIWEAGE
jgi:hypothetical protein